MNLPKLLCVPLISDKSFRVISNCEMCEDYTARIYDERTSDFCFQFQENGRKIDIFVHKIILASHSDVFDTMFYGNIPESGNSATITDVTSNVFMTFLKFAYCGLRDYSKENIFQIYYVAKKYNVTKLIKNIEEDLASLIDSENFFQLLEFCDFFEAKCLLQKCLAFAKENCVFKSIARMEISESLIERALMYLKYTCIKCDDKSCIFYYVVKWASIQCDKDDIQATPENVWNRSKDLMFIIDLGSMRLIKFLKGPFQSDFLPDDEKVKITSTIIKKIGRLYPCSRSKHNPNTNGFYDCSFCSYRNYHYMD